MPLWSFCGAMRRVVAPTFDTFRPKPRNIPRSLSFASRNLPWISVGTASAPPLAPEPSATCCALQGTRLCATAGNPGLLSVPFRAIGTAARLPGQAQGARRLTSRVARPPCPPRLRGPHSLHNALELSKDASVSARCSMAVCVDARKGPPPLPRTIILKNSHP